jgi:hypothetical protein
MYFPVILCMAKNYRDRQLEAMLRHTCRRASALAGAVGGAVRAAEGCYVQFLEYF